MAEVPEEIADKRIAFLFRDQIYTARADGSDRAIVARVPGAYSGPYWSKSAGRFLVRTESKKGGSIYLLERDGSKLVNVSEKAGSTYDAMASWSPDGKYIVFSSKRPRDEQAQIYVMNANGSDVKRLVQTDFEAQYPAWSPDGARISFTGVDDNFDLYVMNSDGSDLTQLTETLEAENWTTWSPDSSEIAFYSEGSEGEAIWAIKPNGSDRRQITDPDITPAGEPNWSRSGPWITFSCAIPPPSKICAIRSDGSSFVNLFSRAGFPFWMD